MTAPAWIRQAAGVALAVAIMAGIAVGIHAHDTRVADAAVAKVRTQTADSVRTVWRDSLEAARADMKRDRVVLTRATTHYVTLRDTVLLHRTDTLVSIDTVRMLVAAADSTIHACSVVLTDCERRAVAAERIVHADSIELDAFRRIRQPRFGVKTGIVLGVLGTLATGWALGKID